jgi:hypothetical protein
MDNSSQSSAPSQLNPQDLATSVQNLTKENIYLYEQLKLVTDSQEKLKAAFIAQEKSSAEIHTRLANSKTPSLKANKPPMFSGKGGELSAFINRCKLCFVSGTTEEAKILFASSFLEGSAYDWLQTSSFFGTLANDVTFTQFETEITRAFGQVDEEASSFNQILSITQGNQPVGDYSNRFNLLAAKAKISDQATLMRLYRNGLSMEIVRNLPGHYSTYVSVSQIQSKASEIYFDMQLDSRRPTQSSSNFHQHPVAMDLSSMITPTSSTLPIEEKQRRRLANLCAYCGKPGCPGGGPNRDVAKCADLLRKNRAGNFQSRS